MIIVYVNKTLKSLHVINLKAAGSLGQLPSTVSSNDKLREDIKKSFHKGYEGIIWRQKRKL